MEDNQTNDVRLFTPAQIAVASFVGTPLAACWLFSKNKRSVGENSSAKKWMIGGIIGTVVLFIITYLIPDYVPNHVIPIGYTIGFYQIAARSFGASPSELYNTKVAKGSWWTASVISIFCFVLVMALVIGIAMIFPETASVE